jgi:hypothetical protein
VTGSVGANQLKIPPTIGICLRTPFKKVLNSFLVIKLNINTTVKLIQPVALIFDRFLFLNQHWLFRSLAGLIHSFSQ